MLTRSRSPSSGSRAIGRATRRWTLAVTVAASSESCYETRAVCASGDARPSCTSLPPHRRSGGQVGTSQSRQAPVCHTVAMNPRIPVVWGGTREEAAGSKYINFCSWMQGNFASRKGFRASGLRLFDSRRLHQFFSASASDCEDLSNALPRLWCSHGRRSSSALPSRA